MEIRSFADIAAIDGELAGLFLCSYDEAVGWIYAVKNGIGAWIESHNKQYWEVVRFVCEQRGILGKLGRDRKTVRLTRKEFALVLLKFCPEVLAKDESESALKSSMEHYPYIAELRRLWNDGWGGSGHVANQHIKQVKALLDNTPLPEAPAGERELTPEEVMRAYLLREVDSKAGRFPCSKVCVGQQYERIRPALSVETYKSERFLREHRPSAIEAYEFVGGVLQMEKLNELIGLYAGLQVKLFIVSTAGLRPDVRARAIEAKVGYVILNPHMPMTSDDYVLPRSIEDNSRWRRNLEVLEGDRPMTTPLLILDGSDALGSPRLTSSLADVLNGYGVAVKKHRLLDIPFLTEVEIEARAEALTRNDVEAKRRMLGTSSLLNADMSIDPFAYAEACGLSYGEETVEGSSQLGRLDVMNSRAILNADGKGNESRYRFTMAHELAHYVLHAPLFRRQGVVSIGESEETLAVSQNGSVRLEYQANRFASYLLMPSRLVEDLYKYYFDMYVTRKYGDTLHPLYYSPQQRETWGSYRAIVVRIARMMRVSEQAMQIRMKSLGLLEMPDRTPLSYNFSFRSKN